MNNLSSTDWLIACAQGIIYGLTYGVDAIEALKKSASTNEMVLLNKLEHKLQKLIAQNTLSYALPQYSYLRYSITKEAVFGNVGEVKIKQLDKFFNKKKSKRKRNKKRKKHQQ